MSDFPDKEQEGSLLTEIESRVEKPKLFKVVLHNDDFTTMEFVVFVLHHVFLRSQAEAVAIMLKVHHEGKGIAGLYPFEVATMKADKAMNFARARQFPFLCTVEEE